MPYINKQIGTNRQIPLLMQPVTRGFIDEFFYNVHFGNLRNMKMSYKCGL